MGDIVWDECSVCGVKCTSQKRAYKHAIRDRKRMSKLSALFARKLYKAFMAEELMAETLDLARELVRLPRSGSGLDRPHPHCTAADVIKHLAKGDQ